MKRATVPPKTEETDSEGTDLTSGERAWVETLVEPLADALNHDTRETGRLVVQAGFRLAYTCAIYGYSNDDATAPALSKYQTDLLISDAEADGKWKPRVVVECKLGGITTHDALTYSAKAATHKNVHPYLRYGVLIGASSSRSLPIRLVKHGSHFDFMINWERSGATGAEFVRFVDLIKEEVTASRQLHDLLTNRTAGRKKFFVLHRPLRLG